MRLAHLFGLLLQKHQASFHLFEFLIGLFVDRAQVSQASLVRVQFFKQVAFAGRFVVFRRPRLDADLLRALERRFFSLAPAFLLHGETAFFLMRLFERGAKPPQFRFTAVRVGAQRFHVFVYPAQSLAGRLQRRLRLAVLPRQSLYRRVEARGDFAQPLDFRGARLFESIQFAFTLLQLASLVAALPESLRELRRLHSRLAQFAFAAVQFLTQGADLLQQGGRLSQETASLLLRGDHFAAEALFFFVHSFALLQRESLLGRRRFGLTFECALTLVQPPQTSLQRFYLRRECAFVPLRFAQRRLDLRRPPEQAVAPLAQRARAPAQPPHAVSKLRQPPLPFHITRPPSENLDDRFVHQHAFPAGPAFP